MDGEKASVPKAHYRVGKDGCGGKVPQSSQTRHLEGFDVGRDHEPKVEIEHVYEKLCRSGVVGIMWVKVE